MNQLRQKLIEFFNKTSGYQSTRVIACRISGYNPEPKISTQKVLGELNRMMLDGLVERHPVKHDYYHYWRAKSE